MILPGFIEGFCLPRLRGIWRPLWNVAPLQEFSRFTAYRIRRDDGMKPLIRCHTIAVASALLLSAELRDCLAARFGKSGGKPESQHALTSLPHSRSGFGFIVIQTIPSPVCYHCRANRAKQTRRWNLAIVAGFEPATR